MAEKRKRDSKDESKDAKRPPKQAKRGFHVGPDNLPDGVYKRKNQEIKRQLIERAQLKKTFEKYKRQGKIAESAPSDHNAFENNGVAEPDNKSASSCRASNVEPSPATNTPHPDRQNLMTESTPPPPSHEPSASHRNTRRAPRPKHQPFQRESAAAQQRKNEAEERQRTREAAEKERQRRIEERDRDRRAMAKARSGGRNGQRKLGRESGVLLSRVKRMVEGR